MKIYTRTVIFLAIGIQSLFCLNIHIGRQGRRQATFERFNNTCGERNIPIIFTYEGMKCEDNKLWMNSTIITVKEDILKKPTGNPQAVLDKYDSICGIRNVVIVFKYTGIRSEANKILLNGSFTVKEDIINDPKMHIKIERCKNKENLDTCELFHNYRTNNYCKTANTFAGEFLSSFEPEWKCPLMKGVYRAKNAEMDATAFFMFPVESWYWKVNAKLLDRDTDRILLCAIVEMHLKRV